MCSCIIEEDTLNRIFPVNRLQIQVRYRYRLEDTLNRIVPVNRFIKDLSVIVVLRIVRASWYFIKFAAGFFMSRYT